MLLLAIAGIYLNFSYVPYGDMWNGTLGFFLKVQDGQYSEWWSFHNDHRIFLARILFWIDYQFFQGLSIFLLISNVALVLIICYVYLLYINGITQVKWDIKDKNSLALWFLLSGCMFSWIQEENFVWGFQSQFFLAQLIPLSALYFLARYIAEKRNKYFIFSILFGLLSAGTMANGILIFPLMFLYMVIMRCQFSKNIIVLIFAIILPLLYFKGYARPAKDGYLLDVLFENFSQIIHYSLVYLGGPFAHFSGFESFKIFFAFLCGIFFVLLLIWAIYLILRSSETNPYIIALIFFILYISATAVITAIGRLVMGIDSALASRYTTPAIMAWMALAIILKVLIQSVSYKAKKIIFVVLVLVLLSIILCQVKALKNNGQNLYEKKIGALALALNIRDAMYIEKLFPMPDYALTVSRFANDKNYSFFGISPYFELNRYLGSYFFSAPSEKCHDFIKVDAVTLDITGYVRVEGKAQWTDSGRPHELIKFIDERNGIISGFALVNKFSLTKNEAKGHGSVEYKKFTGYIQVSEEGRRIRAISGVNDCKFEFFLEPNLNPAFQLQPNLLRTTISYSDVIENVGFNGGDYGKTNKDGAIILGSLVSSDADRGHITFRARPGDIFGYRSGPTGGQQIMRILNSDIVILLPVTSSWVSIKFTGPQLPKKFDVKIVDDGSNWGEWSAIELTKNAEK